MSEAGLLQPLLGVEGSLDHLARLISIEGALARGPDAVLRLAALALDRKDKPARLQERLRLSAAETAKLARAGVSDATFDPASAEREAQAFLYRHGVEAFVDGALMDWARSGDAPDSAARVERVRLPEQWNAPELPVRGADVIALGVAPGPEVGRVIAAFEAWWIAQGFPTDRKLAAAKLAELAHGDK
jgi:poly(A) polymerase